MQRLSSAVTLASLSVLGACAEYQRYERPELFHPPTELRRQHLQQQPGAPRHGVTVTPPISTTSTPPAATSAQLEIAAPTGIIAGLAKPYVVTVNDPHAPCAVAGGGTTGALVDVYPPDVKGQTSQVGRLTRVEIDASKLGVGKSVTVDARSCGATAMSDEAARRRGLLKTSHFPATRDQVNSVSSQLNIWSQDDTANEFGIEFAKIFYAADAIFVNRNDKPLLVYGSSLTARIRFLPARQDVETVYSKAAIDYPDRLFSGTGPDNSPLADVLNFKEEYRPMSFSDILAIFTYQQRADPRQRFVDLLKSAGEILAGAAIFTTSRGYAKGVAFFTGILNPEIEKQLLWDILLHVKNLEARSLKEVEEVSPQGQLRKVVFFPRRPIHGVLPQMPVYIAEIRPDEATISATIIDKQATVTSGTR